MTESLESQYTNLIFISAERCFQSLNHLLAMPIAVSYVFSNSITVMCFGWSNVRNQTTDQCFVVNAELFWHF